MEPEDSGGDDLPPDEETFTVPPGVVPNPRRYFNQTLVPDYRRVSFPIKNIPPAPNHTMIPQNQYTRTSVWSGTRHNGPGRTNRRTSSRISHSLLTPPVPPPHPLYGNRFRPLSIYEEPAGDDDTSPPATVPSGKRPKARETKRVRLTKRKNPPPGVARSYRVRLEPDQAQRAEFKRLFAALRYAAELGGNAVFVCPQRECRVAVGRDFNGARGNALAALGKAEGVAADATSDH